MILPLVWKEYREQRSVWLTLTVLSVAALALPLVYEPEPIYRQSYRDALATAALALGWTYAVVCGAMLLAGEAEANTQEFLDTQPTLRLSLWLGKLGAGALLVAVQLALLGVLVLAQGAIPQGLGPVGVALLLAALGLHGLSWGLLGSALARSVLDAIALAVGGCFLGLPALYLVLWVLLGVLGATAGFEVHGAITLVLAVVAGLALPLPLAAAVYTRRDWTRRRQQAPAPGGAATHRRLAWGPVLWLTWRQMRGLTLGLLLFALVAGLALLGPGVVTWPVLSLAVGVLCGVTVLLDEQQTGAYRFLGDQRLPLGWFWALKVGARLLLALAAVVCMLLPLAVVLLIALAQHPAPGDYATRFDRVLGGPAVLLSRSLGLILFGPVLVGFALGHLCGVLFRKALVALVVALGAAAALVGLWAPSVLLGGVRWWQLLAVPLVLLIASRLLLRHWASDRILTWGVAARLGGAVAAALLLTALGLAYRVAEVPLLDEPADFLQWQAALPAKNEGGDLLRRAVEQVEALSRDRSVLPAPGAAAGGGGLPAVPMTVRVSLVHTAGWRRDEPLSAWLDAQFKGEWPTLLDRASRLPPGPMISLRGLPQLRDYQAVTTAPLASSLLVARGLQRQHEAGDAAAYPDTLRRGLALARGLEHNAGLYSAMRVQHVEQRLVHGLERWLEGPGCAPPLLRQALGLLGPYTASLPASSRPNLMAEYLMAKNGIDRPQDWLAEQWGPPGGASSAFTALLAAAWELPWESARRDRLLRLACWAPEQIPESSLVTSRVLLPGFVGVRSADVARPRRLADLRAAQLVLALRLYQAEKGRPAERLEDLVTEGYLPAVPADPFDGRPFRYRLSAGEEIGWPQFDDRGGARHGQPGGTRQVQKGQGVLWSPGEDRQDGGARHQARPGQARGPEDLIWLVPLGDGKGQ